VDKLDLELQDKHEGTTTSCVGQTPGVPVICPLSEVRTVLAVSSHQQDSLFGKWLRDELLLVEPELSVDEASVSYVSQFAISCVSWVDADGKECYSYVIIYNYVGVNCDPYCAYNLQSKFVISVYCVIC